MSEPTLSTQQPRRRDGLLIGVAIGFSIWLPVMLFSTKFLAKAGIQLFGGVLVALLAIAICVVAIYRYRRQVFARVFGEVQLSVEAISDAGSRVVKAWPDQTEAAKAVAEAFREAAALGGWIVARRALITLLVGMVGSVIAMIGVLFILKQTQALELQNEKLEQQRVLLERQNEILAGEGLWEKLWIAHYSNQPEVRLDAAAELAAKGHLLNGVVLEGPSPPDGRFVNLREKPRFDDGTFDARVALVTIPRRLQRAIEPQTFRSVPDAIAGLVQNSMLRNVTISFRDVPHQDLRGLEFEQAEIDLSAPDRNSAHVCFDCKFEAANIRVQEGRAAFESSTFRDTSISSGFGTVSLLRCDLDSLIARLTWGQDQIRESDGYAVIFDFHGWSGDAGAHPIVQSSSIEHVLFVWQQHEMENVEEFLEKTIDNQSEVGRLYFVEEKVTGDSPVLVILREPTERARAWNSARQR